MSSCNKIIRPVAVVAILTVAFVAVSGPVGATQSAPEPAVIIELQADGSATVSVRSTFDLTTEAERDAFRSLMDDEQAQQNARDRFLRRMQSVANDAENATGRAMSVVEASIDLRRSDNNETGIVTLSVTWEGLAAVEEKTLKVTEPFASGFSADRPVTLRVPEGYTFASVSPEPDDREEARVTWEAGTDLTGLAVELVPEETPTETQPEQTATEAPGQPGFGWLVALLAVAGTAGLSAWRRRGR